MKTLFKYTLSILVLLSVLSCKQKPSGEFVALNSHPEVNQQRVSLTENVLKYVTHEASVIALTGATIIDGTGNSAKTNQTVLISDGHFHAIGESSEIRIPKNATIIAANGKTIIPGIIGVHNHLHMPGFRFIGEVASKLYLASGVTTIQTCGSAAPQHDVDLAQSIANGEQIGPDIVTSGPYFTGVGGNQNMIIPRNRAHIRDTMRYWTKKGVRWFKVYRHTNPDDLKVIVEEAQAQNAKVTGHLCATTFEQAVNLGIDGIEHGLNSASDFRNNKTYGTCDGSREYIDNLDIAEEKVKRLQQLMIDKNVFLTSTLAIFESSIPQRAFADERTLEAMSPFLKAQYRERRKNFDNLEAADSLRIRRLKRIMEFEHQFFAMGGRLTAGVDPGRHVLPGFGDQRNYELLIEAGFTMEEAIQVMTGNGAKALSLSDMGLIKKGLRANFVLIDGNLKENTDNIRNVETVFKDGYGYDPNLILKEVKGKVGLN